MSGRSREAIGPKLKTFLSLHRWTWMLVTSHSPLTQPAMGPAIYIYRLEISRFKRAVGQNLIEKYANRVKFGSQC